MSFTTATIKTLLNKVDTIVKHQKEMTIAKGEHYNMFSVLKIETRENNTHSAFLADLLNPKGAHKMGDVFLKLFLKLLNTDLENENTDASKNKFTVEAFVTTNARVKVEHTIGKVKLCNKEHENRAEATGGRIDILLRDKNDTLISIENKIHAGDQELQIQRYCNYKPNYNTVLYLTLDGGDPSEWSKFKLESGKDFYNISYKHHIKDWLELCLKEVANFTSLRETINQYILLIKKLTYTLNAKEDKELMNVMLQNLEATKFIKENYEKMLGQLRNDFRTSVKDALEEALEEAFKDKPYTVSIGGSIENKYAQIWISLNKKPEPEFFFGVESFTGRGNWDGNLFVGILNMNKSPLIAKLEDKNKLSAIWRQVMPIKTDADNFINLSNDYWITVLADKKSTKYKNAVASCVSVAVAFVEEYDKKLKELE